MIRFNLADPGATATPIHRPGRIAALLWIGGLALGGAHWKLVSERQFLQQEIVRTTAELGQMGAAEAEIATLERIIEERHAKSDARSAEAEPWKRTTCELSQLIGLLPDGVLLEEIVHEGGSWTIAGVGQSPSMVADLMARLVDQGFSTGAVEMSERQGKGSAATSFRLEVG